MSAIAEPRLGGGFAVSVFFHGALVAAFFLLHAGTPPPTPPLYRVELFAAPAGERAVGAVQGSGTAAVPLDHATGYDGSLLISSAYQDKDSLNAIVVDPARSVTAYVIHEVRATTIPNCATR